MVRSVWFLCLILETSFVSFVWDAWLGKSVFPSGYHCCYCIRFNLFPVDPGLINVYVFSSAVTSHLFFSPIHDLKVVIANLKLGVRVDLAVQCKAIFVIIQLALICITLSKTIFLHSHQSLFINVSCILIWRDTDLVVIHTEDRQRTSKL